MLKLKLKTGETVRVDLSEAFREKITAENVDRFHDVILDPEANIVPDVVPTEDYRLCGELIQPRNDCGKRFFVGSFWAKCQKYGKAEFCVEVNVECLDGVCCFEVLDMRIRGTLDEYLVKVLDYTIQMIITGNEQVHCLPFVRHSVMEPKNMEYVAAGTSKVFYLSVRNALSVSNEFMMAMEVRSVRYSVFLLTKTPHVEEIEKVIAGYSAVSLDPRRVFVRPRNVNLPCREKVNFMHILPESGDSPFTESGRMYLIRYEIVPKFGAKLVFPIRVECY